MPSSTRGEAMALYPAQRLFGMGAAPHPKRRRACALAGTSVMSGSAGSCRYRGKVVAALQNVRWTARSGRQVLQI